jgi:hypothetical protein
METMMTKRLAIASLVGAAVLAASAGAEVIAGWDFSQFKVPGSLTGGGSPLPANYAYDDPNGAGSGANAIGSATLSGLLPTAGEGLDCERLPFEPLDGCATPNVDGPVRSNRSEPFSLGRASFGAHSILAAEGQTYTHRYGMIAPNGDATIVFEVDAPSGGADWKISFGGRMMSGSGEGGGQIGCEPGCTAGVQARFSTDGVNYGSAVNETLTTEDRRIELALSPGAATIAFVELTLDGSAGRRPVIDNVAIEATPLPEPAAAAGVLAGAALLLALRRFRR